MIQEISNTGVITRTEFDEYGTVTHIDHGDGTATMIEPGAWGEPLKVTGRDGLVTEYELDPAGLVTAVVNPLGVRVEYEYDWLASGLVPLAMVGPTGLVYVTECDNAGRMIASVDTTGRRSSLMRDVRGLVVEFMDPVGKVTQVEYSPEGWPTKVVFPDGGHGLHRMMVKAIRSKPSTNMGCAQPHVIQCLTGCAKW
ncbi:MAG: hypothetical protein Q4A82_07295 [Corynebacterium sp.]|nr:hypothetical protein [Corynebacterium sp.]